jgi:hypothetical protein
VDHSLIDQALPSGEEPHVMIHMVFADTPWESAAEERESEQRLQRFCGTQRPIDVLRECTIRGTVEDMKATIAEHRAAGAHALVMLPIATPDGYIDRFAPLAAA